MTTHRHWDHTRALQGAVDTWSPRTYAGAADADDIPVAPHVRLEDGDEVRFGEVTLIVRHVRGHTPGSVVLAYADERDGTHLFTGDTLFPGGVGATTAFPYQSFEQLYADVTERVFAPHPDSAWFYPGHGADSTLGAERPHLDEWRERGW